MCSINPSDALVGQLPSADDLRVMHPSEVEALARELDGVRRAAEVAMAELVSRVERAGAHLADGHRRPSAWLVAACNWSRAEAQRTVRSGRLLERFASASGMGVAQLHALAALAANPRVQHALDEAEALLVGQSHLLRFDDYVTFLARWEAAADPDGAADSHERAHAGRRARLSTVGMRTFLDAECGNAQGEALREVFDAFCETEFLADWEAGVATHGVRMSAALLGRTDAQRRFDALFAIFTAAASSRGGEVGVTVDVVVDQATFEAHLQAALTGSPLPSGPATGSLCRTGLGRPVSGFDAVAAALVGHVRRVVLDPAGVVIDVGRRQRLFSGSLREVLQALHPGCAWHGCDRRSEQLDHVVPWARGGPTDAANAAPLCGHHNRWRTRGHTTRRDASGGWRHFRPDGTEIGWPVAA